MARLAGAYFFDAQPGVADDTFVKRACWFVANGVTGKGKAHISEAGVRALTVVVDAQQ